MNVDALLEATGQTFSEAALSPREAAAARTSREHVYDVDGGRVRQITRQHGTRSCYVGGCREPGCVRANREYQARWKR